MSDYNLDELEIALNPAHPKHLLPPPLPVSMRVLDIGCGAGQSLVGAYPDRLSYGIDINLEAIKLGRTLTSRIAFSNGTAEALPFRDGEFDFVFCRVALPYTNVPISLKEMRRVLKGDGKVWLALHSLREARRAFNGSYTGILWFGYILLNSLAFHVFGKQFPFRGRYESFQTEGGIRRALARSGFVDVRISRGRHFLVTASIQETCIEPVLVATQTAAIR